MSLKAPVRLQFGDAAETSGSTANLSRGGFFVAFRPPKPVGTLVRFEIDLPGLAAPLAGFGEVAWIRVRDLDKANPMGMGIRFRHLPEPGAEELRQHLARSEEFSDLAAASGIGEEDFAAPEEGEPQIPSWRLKYPEPLPDLGEEPGAEGDDAGIGMPAHSGEPAWREATRHGTVPGVAAGAAAAAPAPPWRRLALLGAVGALLVVAALVAGRALLGGGGSGDAAEGETREPAPPAPPSPDPGAAEPAAEGSLPAAAGAEPAAAPAAAPASAIREISWTAAPGETVVVVAGEGGLAADRIRHERLAGSPPRELVKIGGITAPYRQTAIAVGTAELLRIRTGHHPEKSELHVVLDLPAESAGIDRVEPQAGGVRLYLKARNGG